MPDEVPFLWSHRKIKDFHRNEIMSMEAAGIRKHVIRDVLQCRYGGYDKVGIVTKDIYNYCSKNKRSRIAEGDARTVLGLLLKRRNTDPDFYFDYKVDDDSRLMSLFWCDTQSRMDYQSFGDVVVFDSTYRMNRYKMPFVPFVGLNHHRNTTVFGCGIICDERADSYIWVLQAFLKAMCQKKPQSVITDGDYSMIKAIRQVLPGVSHRICSWHVEKNILKHLHSNCLDGFRTLLYYASSETFEARWNAFLSEYETATNREWLAMMYKNRKLWAAAFQRDKFFLGMRSNQRSESLNSSLHRHLDIYMSLLDLVEHYENCVSRLRETEHELLKINDYHIHDRIIAMGSSRYFLVHNEKKKSVFEVDYWSDTSGHTIHCSCRKMELFDPIIAATKGAPRKNSNVPNNSNVDGLSKKRYKSFVEKRQYKCTLCKQQGHNRKTCEKQVQQGCD
ncbi:protein FAR1-RELATED SEQUENCE 5 [Sorghum bicolor]|uniref:protein FAR1-RELATED SEQUENCE 5 n=1 Tax=Sorghum bicolor TaxID=4558 RepID=UPI000B426BDD|nr:protein FAR1-RELATED SEQUENCE 5 [Sorghum bicolor]XP_021315143.1 protein FAR1-RELATED SEQUENCE 5 [Sorghum bicolor]|eukprot:XP_021311955.1 protein FAR1-RELATED SEQUENCE 5 [Sorghum bicolor]